MLETKKISPDAINRLDSKKYFLEYMEDFNTATLPHEKYYDLDKWLAKEKEKMTRKDAKKRAKQADAAPPAVNLLADEDRLRSVPHSVCVCSVVLC